MRYKSASDALLDDTSTYMPVSLRPSLSDTLYQDENIFATSPIESPSEKLDKIYQTFKATRADKSESVYAAAGGVGQSVLRLGAQAADYGSRALGGEGGYTEKLEPLLSQASQNMRAKSPSLTDEQYTSANAIGQKLGYGLPAVGAILASGPTILGSGIASGAIAAFGPGSAAQDDLKDVSLRALKGAGEGLILGGVAAGVMHYADDIGKVVLDAAGKVTGGVRNLAAEAVHLNPEATISTLIQKANIPAAAFDNPAVKEAVLNSKKSGFGLTLGETLQSQALTKAELDAGREVAQKLAQRNNAVQKWGNTLINSGDDLTSASISKTLKNHLKNEQASLKSFENTTWEAAKTASVNPTFQASLLDPKSKNFNALYQDAQAILNQNAVAAQSKLSRGLGLTKTEQAAIDAIQNPSSVGALKTSADIMDGIADKTKSITNLAADKKLQGVDFKQLRAQFKSQLASESPEYAAALKATQERHAALDTMKKGLIGKLSSLPPDQVVNQLAMSIRRTGGIEKDIADLDKGVRSIGAVSQEALAKLGDDLDKLGPAGENIKKSLFTKTLKRLVSQQPGAGDTVEGLDNFISALKSPLVRDNLKAMIPKSMNQEQISATFETIANIGKVREAVNAMPPMGALNKLADSAAKHSIHLMKDKNIASTLFTDKAYNVAKERSKYGILGKPDDFSSLLDAFKATDTTSRYTIPTVQMYQDGE